MKVFIINRDSYDEFNDETWTVLEGVFISEEAAQRTIDKIEADARKVCLKAKCWITEHEVQE